MASCQVTGIPNEIWQAFRFACLKEGISANRKLLRLIREHIEQADGGIEGTKSTHREELANEGR